MNGCRYNREEEGHGRGKMRRNDCTWHKCEALFFFFFHERSYVRIIVFDESTRARWGFRWVCHSMYFITSIMLFSLLFLERKRKKTLEKAQLLSPRERKCYYRTDCSSRLRWGICCKRQTTSGIWFEWEKKLSYLFIYYLFITFMSHICRSWLTVRFGRFLVINGEIQESKMEPQPQMGFWISLWNFICFMPFFIALLILGFLKGSTNCSSSLHFYFFFVIYDKARMISFFQVLLCSHLYFSSWQLEFLE